MRKATFISLVLLTLVSSFLRLYQLDTLPSILNRDEAALAYNAYLLAETGRDEWGRHWPLALESFGDYKLPGYPVALAFFFKLLPLADWVVRLPSAVMGSLLIVAMYFLAKNLGFSEKNSIVASALTAFTPIFFFYSRIAFEANVALTITVTALALLLSQVVHKRYLTDGLACFLLALASLTYNTPLLLLPFLIPLLVWWRGWQQPRQWLGTVAALVLLFLAGFSLLSTLSSQKSGITIFEDETTWATWTEERQQLPSWQQKLFANKPLFFFKLTSQHFVQAFSPAFLVKSSGGHPWHSLPTFGHLTWILYFLAASGLLVVLSTIWRWLHHMKSKPKLLPKTELTLLYLAATSLIPASITVDAPHATRSLLFFIMLTLLASKALASISQTRKNISVTLSQILIIISALLILFEFSWYLNRYFSVYPSQASQILQAGFAGVIQQTATNDPDESIVIVDPEGYHYILAAWYLKLSSDDFFTTIVKQLPNKIGFRYGEKVANYHFIAHPNDRVETETVLIEWSSQDSQWQVKRF